VTPRALAVWFDACVHAYWWMSVCLKTELTVLLTVFVLCVVVL